MNFLHFAELTKLFEKTELEKIKIIALYNNFVYNTNTFSLNLVTTQLKDIGHPISNISRLRVYLAKSKDFKKIGQEDEYLLTPSARKKLLEEYKSILYNEESIESSNEILDEALFLGKRGFLDKLIKQINHCYQSNCYDACAVLMRRVFEIVLILAYEKLGMQNQIKDHNGDYIMLERIVANAIQNQRLNVSRTKKEYDDIRDTGNFAAHKIHYNTRKSDIDAIKQKYRVCLEELYYKAGLIE
jgi:hypothetical protein